MIVVGSQISEDVVKKMTPKGDPKVCHENVIPYTSYI